MDLDFVKMEGLGNDFIMLDDREGRIVSHISYPRLAKQICSRNFGIGADGIILILNPADSGDPDNPGDHDIKFRVYNCDGSQAQMCGNGMRCFAKYLYEHKIFDKKIIRVDTKAGTVIPEVIIDDKNIVVSVRVDMGEPVLESAKIPIVSDNEKILEELIDVDGEEYKITGVSMGNPHAVIFVDDVSKIPLKEIGPKIEIQRRFPEKTNVEFIEVVSDNELKMRVWERGAGITLACGTGACAAHVAANLTGRAKEKTLIHLDGGCLEVFWDKQTNHVFKTGPATLVFEGKITI
ncbi:MAG: diaminopimelate epimerase [Desulfobacula sp.]|nr:diaminopimelate epimerase [Desulfobacula sp.]